MLSWSPQHTPFNLLPFLFHCEAARVSRSFRYLDLCFPNGFYVKYSQCPIPLNCHRTHTMNKFTSSVSAITRTPPKYMESYMWQGKVTKMRKYKVHLMDTSQNCSSLPVDNFSLFYPSLVCTLKFFHNDFFQVNAFSRTLISQLSTDKTLYTDVYYKKQRPSFKMV